MRPHASGAVETFALVLVGTGAIVPDFAADLGCFLSEPALDGSVALAAVSVRWADRRSSHGARP